MASMPNSATRRHHAIGTRGAFGPETLSVAAVGASWTVATLGWLLGTGAAYWGGLMLSSALWLTATALDRLQQTRAVRADLAAILRATVLGFSLLLSATVLDSPLQHVAAWTTLIITAGAAHLMATGVQHLDGERPWRRSLDALKLAGGIAGGTIALPMIVASLPGLGLELSPTDFQRLVACAGFCVFPTIMIARR